MQYMPRVYNFFRYRTCNDALAEDLTSKTFEKAWRNRRQYQHDVGAFSTWLFTIARNVAIDHFRQPARELPLEKLAHLANDHSLEETFQRESDLRQLSQLLAELSAREQELIALKYGMELNNREIAQLTNISESNVGTILHRVVAKLRERWEAE